MNESITHYENATISDDDDGIEEAFLRLVAAVQTAQAVREPRDSVALAAARAVLHKVVLSRTIVTDLLQQCTTTASW